jgi:hypothetical protein
LHCYVEVEVLVGTAVGHDDRAIVGVGSVEEGGEHHAAGGDAGQNERIDFVGAQKEFEIGAREGAPVPGIKSRKLFQRYWPRLGVVERPAPVDGASALSTPESNARVTLLA